MTILLIRPNPPKETIGLQHVMICEPLELEYLAGNIDKGKADIYIIDMILEKKQISYFIDKYKPNIVGITAYITHIGIVKDMARQIKSIDEGISVIVGGVHAEVVPQDFVSPYIDYIICENPISTFKNIVDSLIKTGDNKLSISGTYNSDKSHNRNAHFDYKMPDRSKVAHYRHKYYYMFHNPCALIKTSFGCPYSCNFCFCKEVTGGKYYARPIEEVIDEISSISEKEIYIVDDDFLFNKERLNRFCDLLEEKNLKKYFLVYGRADFIANNEDIIKRLSKNGLRAVIVGIESIREKDLIDFNKKTTNDINEKAVEILKKYDIELYATMILQLDYSKQDFKELEKSIKKMDITFVNLQPLTPLPGTDIFEKYQDKLIVKREDYAKWDLAHIVLKPEHMSIRAYYYQIIRLYFKIVMRPKSIYKMLRKYGLFPVIKMWYGSNFVSLQYIAKMIKGS